MYIWVWFTLESSWIADISSLNSHMRILKRSNPDRSVGQPVRKWPDQSPLFGEERAWLERNGGSFTGRLSTVAAAAVWMLQKKQRRKGEKGKGAALFCCVVICLLRVSVQQQRWLHWAVCAAAASPAPIREIIHTRMSRYISYAQRPVHTRAYLLHILHNVKMHVCMWKQRQTHAFCP